MAPNCQPKLDATQELDLDGITMYQELIGELHWATEMGGVDILFEQLLRICGFLKYTGTLILLTCQYLQTSSRTIHMSLKNSIATQRNYYHITCHSLAETQSG